MRRRHREIPLAMVFIEGLIVGAGLLVASSTYSYFTAATARCGNFSSGTAVLQLLLLLWLALPLAVGLLLYVVVTAVQDRRWAWLATVVLAVLAVAASALIALAGPDSLVRPVVAAVLGNLNGTCSGFAGFIAYFVALAVVELTCLVYLVLSPPARPNRSA